MMPDASSTLPPPVHSNAWLDVRILPGVRSITREDWDALFPGEAEGWAYYVACEAAPPPAFTFPSPPSPDPWANWPRWRSWF